MFHAHDNSTCTDFLRRFSIRVDIRVGRIVSVSVDDCSGIEKAACKLTIDFGTAIGQQEVVNARDEILYEF